MSEPLHLVKVPLRAERLASIARDRRLSLREMDDGYLGHVILRELWQELAPAPFVLQGSGRRLVAWGYSRADAAALRQRATEFGDPSLLAAVAGLDEIASRSMPRFEAGRRLGFAVRACPIVRLAAARNGHKAGAEVDAFLARCFAVGDAPVSREEVYRDWLRRTLGEEGTTGVTVSQVAVVAMSRERLIRRTHGESRHVRSIERPDVRLAGELVVTDGDRLLAYLSRGVGRHRAFGFGALLLSPPGSRPTLR